MADESLVNGVAAGEGEDQAAESFYDFDTATKVSDLVKKVEVLEREKVELVKENEEIREKGKTLEAEILGLRGERERMEELVRKAEEDGKVLGAIAGRAADLETEVSRLQHDLVSAMSEGDDVNKELIEVKKALEESKVRAVELEREKELIKERLVGEIEEVKMAKAVAEAKVKGVGEDAKAELEVKDGELNALKKKVAELEDAVANGGTEFVKENAEKKALKLALEASEAKVAELETMLIQLQKKAEEAEKVISELKKNTAEAVNGVIDRDAVLVNDGSKKGTINLQWAVGAGVSAVVIGGAICLLYAKKRFRELCLVAGVIGAIAALGNSREAIFLLSILQRSTSESF